MRFQLSAQKLSKTWCKLHPWRPTGSLSGREKKREESFQVQAREPLGTDSHRTISKNSSWCWLLIEHKKFFVLLCPIGKQFLLSSIREFVHDGYCLDHGLSGSCTREMHTVRKLSVWHKISFCTVVKTILSGRRIRESSRHVFPGGAGSGRHITIDVDSSIQVSSSCQTL